MSGPYTFGGESSRSHVWPAMSGGYQFADPNYETDAAGITTINLGGGPATAAQVFPSAGSLDDGAGSGTGSESSAPPSDPPPVDDASEAPASLPPPPLCPEREAPAPATGGSASPQDALPPPPLFEKTSSFETDAFGVPGPSGPLPRPAAEGAGLVVATPVNAPAAPPRPRGEAEYTGRFAVTKHSWKGKYTRILCIGPSKIATINPNSIFRVTNQWEFKNCLIDVVAVPRTLAEFTITVRRGGKTENLTFTSRSAMERAELLTEVQQYRTRFDPRHQQIMEQYPARKYCTNEEYRACSLRLTSTGVVQIDREGREVGWYFYMHIKGLTSILDCQTSLIIMYGPQLKLHKYNVENPRGVIQAIQDNATRFIGLPPYREMKRLHQEQFDLDRLGVDREKLAAIVEFPVMKLSPKHGMVPVSRILSTTNDLLVERDPATYNATSAYFLIDVHAFIRCDDDDQKFMIEYKEPHIVKCYTSPVRDALLASLADSCRSCGNLNACVISTQLDCGKRAGPCRTVVSEEIESTLLHCLTEPEKGGGPVTMPYSEVIEFFIANVEFSGLRVTENRDGLFTENREKLIYSALSAILSRFPTDRDANEITQSFYAMRRLCVTRIGFSSVAIIPTLFKGVGAVSVSALKLNIMAVSHAVVEFLNVLMTPHHNNYEVIHEQINKNRMLMAGSFVKHLLLLLRSSIESDRAALLVLALLNFFVYALCPPYSETTYQQVFVSVMKQLVETVGRQLLLLFAHPCNAIRFAAGQLIRVILEEGDEEHFNMMQHAALSECGFLRQFHVAAFSENRPLRDLARRLIAFWTYENSKSQDLLRHMLPLTLLHFLKSNEAPPASEVERDLTTGVQAASADFKESKTGWLKKSFHPKEVLEQGSGSETAATGPVRLRQRTIRVNPTLNWALFFHQLKKDHLRPDLIWNHSTRTELREAIETEIQAFQVGAELRKERAICWNYQEFEVQYPSLADELKIGNHYPRLLFESKTPVIARPKEFFNDLYHRFLLVLDTRTKIQCLHGMSVLYTHYADDIGQFNDIEFMIKFLDSTTDPIFRDRMIDFLFHLLRTRLNVKPFIDCGGLQSLVDLMVLAHLHIDRPQLHAVSNAIEFLGKPADLQDREKEWYYTVDGSKSGPVSYAELKRLHASGLLTGATKVWAQGLSGWKPLADVPQLRWGIVAEGKPTLWTPSEMTCNILDILLQLCAYYPSRDENGSVMQPLPKVKRYLSGAAVLPHLVQLLLTFDPSICTRVHMLLLIIMEDNPVMPRFFLTGAFFFALMYMGSDVLPLCRLLGMSHRKQLFKYTSDNEIIRSSILAPILPPALVCFLSTHGPEKFADIFLGEYETPEAIWGSDMRRYMVEKIASHISDFTPRLLGNCRAVYQYCPLVTLQYDKLKHELFCSQYYLRHLCDEARYPNWVVADPIALLREVLLTWQRELEKKTSDMTRERCLEDLEIPDGDVSPAQVRKAYFRLAAQYHPDKNPNGREKFERIQRAYELLASNDQFSCEPNPHNIALVVKTQSILFKRFGEEVSKYKYAGYGLLLRLVERELQDPDMTTKEVVLLEPATELCYYTVRNVALNADELQEEGGIALLRQALERAMEQVTPNSKESDAHVKIATSCLKTFHVSAQFPDCRRRIMSEPTIPFLAAKCIAYEKAAPLSRAAIQCCQSLCMDAELQSKITAAGAFWHLIAFLFRYDSTLEDNGVELTEEHHVQLFANRAAEYALQAIYAMAGFRPDETYPVTKPNLVLYKTLQKLLTPYVVRKMRMTPGGEREVLKLLNGNHETPYIFWNNATRAELQEYVSRNSDLCRDAGMHTENLPPIECDDFAYASHRRELIIGGVFVRIYNEKPSFPIEDPAAFFVALMNFLTHQQNNDNDTTGVGMAVDSVRHLVNAYPTTIVLAEQNMVVLINTLHFAEITVTPKCMQTLEAICSNPRCAEAAGKQPHTIAEVILAMLRGEDVYGSSLDLLRALLNDRLCVEQALNRGLYVVLLMIFQTSRSLEIKEKCCVCMTKLVMDRLHGPKVFLRATKLIPAVLLETMKENPSVACQMLDTWQDTPELVWTQSMRQHAIDRCTAAYSDLVEALRANPDTYWKLPENLAEERVEDIQVGGVFLVRYLKQPGWEVRKPKDFLIALLERVVQECSVSPPNAEVLQLVADANVAFMQTSPSMVDYIASLGYVQRLFKLLESDLPLIRLTGLRLLHGVCGSRVCVESMGQIDSVGALTRMMSSDLEDISLLMDTLHRLLTNSTGQTSTLRLVLHHKLPQRLLELLETGASSKTSNPGATRALIIKVVKAMLVINDPVNQPALERILEGSAVWSKYKGQSHDLFLTDNHIGGYLAGPKNDANKLSLTAPPIHSSDCSEPPPL